MKKYFLVLLFLSWGDAHTQSLYDNNNVTTIEIFFSNSNWDQILDNYYAAGMDQRLIADSVLINGTMKEHLNQKMMPKKRLKRRVNRGRKSTG